LRLTLIYLYTKFGKGILKGGRVMAIYVFSKWRPATMLNFHKVKFEGISVSGMSAFLSQPNFV